MILRAFVAPTFFVIAASEAAVSSSPWPNSPKKRPARSPSTAGQSRSSSGGGGVDEGTGRACQLAALVTLRPATDQIPTQVSGLPSSGTNPKIGRDPRGSQFDRLEPLIESS